MKCTNNHNYSKTFDEMEKISKTNPISNYSCPLCESEKKLSNIHYYCLNCYKFYCYKHGETHNLKENHKIFFSKNFDSWFQNIMEILLLVIVKIIIKIIVLDVIILMKIIKKLKMN